MATCIYKSSIIVPVEHVHIAMRNSTRVHVLYTFLRSDIGQNDLLHVYISTTAITDVYRNDSKEWNTEMYASIHCDNHSHTQCLNIHMY